VCVAEENGDGSIAGPDRLPAGDQPAQLDDRTWIARQVLVHARQQQVRAGAQPQRSRPARHLPSRRAAPAAAHAHASDTRPRAPAPRQLLAVT